ncbi:MAG: hypothetical protein J6Q85_08255 [Clostridia bacterium]|nr:hypothetical protein [Clostridia bacterium]
MTRLNRILALALTLVLMLGAVVGVVSSAAYDAEGYILATNVAYDDAIAPMFAISKEKVASVSGLTVTVDGVDATYVGTTENLFNTSDKDIEEGTAEPVAAHIFKAAGIAPKLLDEDLEVVVSVNGEAVATFTYNVALDYFQAKLDAGATGNKKALYEAVLVYAAAAKAQFG